MTMLRILDSSGDTVVEFDEATADQTAKAKATFDAWLGKERTAIMTKRADGKPDLKVTDFGQIEAGSETLLIPKIAAG